VLYACLVRLRCAHSFGVPNRPAALARACLLSGIRTLVYISACERTSINGRRPMGDDRVAFIVRPDDLGVDVRMLAEQHAHAFQRVLELTLGPRTEGLAARLETIVGAHASAVAMIEAARPSSKPCEARPRWVVLLRPRARAQLGCGRPRGRRTARAGASRGDPHLGGDDPPGEGRRRHLSLAPPPLALYAFACVPRELRGER